MKIFLTASLLIGLLIAARVKPAGNNQAEVNQLQGIYIFTDCRPLDPYDYLGTVKNGTRLSGSAQYQPVRDRLLKKLKQDYPEANGAIFYFNNGSADRADAIKFRQ